MIQRVTAVPAQGGDSFVFPHPLNLSATQLSAFKSYNDLYMPGWIGKNKDYQWPWAHGGAALDAIAIDIDLRGNRNSPVRITGVDVDKRCSSPLTGALFLSEAAGEGAVIQMGFDLDKINPIASAVDDSHRIKGSYFATKTVTLAYGEQQELKIFAPTTKYYCEFNIDLQVLDNTKTVHETVSNNGQPFRVTARISPSDPLEIKYSAYQELYAGGVDSASIGCSDRWVRVNPGTFSQEITNGNQSSCNH